MKKARWSQLLVFGPSVCLIQSLHYQHPSSSMPMSAPLCLSSGCFGSSSFLRSHASSRLGQEKVPWSAQGGVHFASVALLAAVRTGRMLVSTLVGTQIRFLAPQEWPLAPKCMPYGLIPHRIWPPMHPSSSVVRFLGRSTNVCQKRMRFR